MFHFTDEQNLLMKSVSDLAKAELDPIAAEIDEKEGFNAAAFKSMARLGLLGITAGERYGGAGLGSLEATLAMEKLGEHCASTALSYLAHSILCVNNIHENGSETQKEKYLPKLINGEWLGGMGMTEPQAGSDTFGIKTKAVRQGSKYILDGTKMFITNGTVGDVFVIYARTGEPRKNISTFIVEKSFPGFRVGKKLRKMGMRGSPTSELIFEHCEVPAENLVGKENESSQHLMRNLNIERITISGISIGLATASLEHAAQYARERSQFGKLIGHFEMIQEKIAEMVVQRDAARALTYAAATAYDRGLRDLSLGAEAKLYSAQIATRVALDAIQILGGYGYMKEYPVERYMRDAKLMEIGAGTNEIMRLIVAREYLKLREE